MDMVFCDFPNRRMSRIVMVGAIVGDPGNSYALDATDAIAVAVTHALAVKRNDVLGR